MSGGPPAAPALARLAVAVLAAVLPLAAGDGDRLTLWRLEPAGLTADPGAPDRLPAVGSLMKPFVAKAWALAHPAEPSPRFACPPDSVCWFKPGHGELGLAEALTVSCNTYFLRLAEATPLATLAATLAGEGFQPPPRSALEAMGLGGSAGAPGITPSALLAAYVRLVREPWPPAAEPIRQEVLAGLREAALTGTAAALGHRGFWAKTGTVAGTDGNPLHTVGLALAVDDAGWAILARMEPGRGAEAARALAGPIRQLRPWAQPSAGLRPTLRTSGPARPLRAWDDPGAIVTVRLFALLKSQRYTVRNLGADPIPCAAGFLGPGASRELAAGDAVGPGLLELGEAGTGLRRRLQGELRCQGQGGRLTLVARMSPREYVAGVLAAERPGHADAQASWRRVELGAAILRFLGQGPRHPEADVCDSTHCAYFIGRGPRLQWSARGTARPAPGPAVDADLPDDVWSAMCAASRMPGPSQWSTSNGGRPLSARAVWGGDPPGPDAAAATSAPGTRTHPWSRFWSDAQAARAFGGPVERMEAGLEDGVWTLEVWSGSERRPYRFDQAHRLLAKVLGWDALPSPADAVTKVEGGFRATGVGQGHRVGLALVD